MGETGAIHPVMVGTAGHIDHGKSSLVRALTGIDPDRLKEEKERGLTIDLGFAPLRLGDGRTMGMIDVPGHERLVRNMVAGSTSLDIALLVVAADDGVMPQTREHLDILDLLGVERGVVALTKVDLVDAEIAELAEAEITQLLASTALAGAPVVHVSATTGQGIDELRELLAERASQVEPRSDAGPFRMPVQRTFQLKGIGTVVTGVPLSGSVAPGDVLEFQPGGRRSKVRGIQAFGGSVERAVAGHSTALSVPDARAAGLRRGMVACTPDIFRTGDAVDVELRMIERARPVRHRADVRFHSGTAESHGQLLLLDTEVLQGGETCLARVLLAEPVCVAPGDRFLLRLQNPVVTVGGGAVVRLQDAPRRYRRRGVGEELERLRAAGGASEDRVIEELRLAGPAGLSADELAASLATGSDLMQELLLELPQVHVSERVGRAFLESALDEGIAELGRSVQRMLRDKPLAASVMRSRFRPSRELPTVLLDAVLEELQRQGRVRMSSQGRVLFTDRLAPLAPEDQTRLDRLVDFCASRGFRPPTQGELEAELGFSSAQLDGLVARALDEARLDQVGDHVYAATTLQTALRAIRRNCLAHDGELEIPSLRDELGTSRKFLIPLLEHVDGLGLTRLRGGVRVLLPSSAVCQELAADDQEADATGG